MTFRRALLRMSWAALALGLVLGCEAILVLDAFWALVLL